MTHTGLFVVGNTLYKRFQNLQNEAEHMFITVFTKVYQYIVMERRPWYKLPHLPRAVHCTLLTLRLLGLHFHLDDGGSILL
jgi:hypothetical protein